MFVVLMSCEIASMYKQSVIHINMRRDIKKLQIFFSSSFSPPSNNLYPYNGILDVLPYKLLTYIITNLLDESFHCGNTAFQIVGTW